VSRTGTAPQRHYVYLGDRWTRPELKGARCTAVVRSDGKCICGRGAMLVTFDAFPALGRVVIVRRLLRKVTV
jgi:hypothetical protein